MMAYPTFFALYSLATLLALLLLRRWQRLAPLGAGAATLLLAGWSWLARSFQPILGDQWIDLFATAGELGYQFQLRAENAPVFLLALGIVGLILLGSSLAPQGEWMPPLALLLQIGYGAILLLVDAPVDPLFLTPLLLAGMAALSVFLLYGNIGPVRSGQGMGGILRFLLPSVFAFPFFLIAVWYSDLILLNPQDSELYQAMGWLLSLGLILLLAPAPLHNSQPVSAQHSPPLALALVTLLYQLSVLTLLFRLGIQFPYISEVSPFVLWLTVGGTLTALWGGVAAAATLHPGRLWGYAALHDWGVLLLLLAVPGDESWPLALFLFGLRGVSMVTVAVALAQLSQSAQGMEPEQLQGVGSRRPWTTIAFLLGGLGLAGFPLTAGFSGRWSALQATAENDWVLAAVVLLASAGVAFGFIRLVRVLFGPLQNRLIPREQVGTVAVAMLWILLAVTLALAPQTLDAPMRWALAIFE